MEYVKIKREDGYGLVHYSNKEGYPLCGSTNHGTCWIKTNRFSGCLKCRRIVDLRTPVFDNIIPVGGSLLTELQFIKICTLAQTRSIELDGDIEALSVEDGDDLIEWLREITIK